MLDYDRFSSLRLGHIFPADHLEAYPYYTALRPGGDFDTEYQGGQWHEELIDGAQFFYPSSAGDKLGIVELWGAGCVLAAAVRDRPEPGALFVPAWTANASRVLEALELPFRLGAGGDVVESLAAGRVHATGYADEWYDRREGVAKGTLASLCFTTRGPSVYHMQAVVHTTEGLLSLAIRRPDLIRANESDRGSYDEWFGPLFDEG